MPGTASFSSTTTSRTPRGGQRRGSSRTTASLKNKGQQESSEAGVLVWDAPSIDDTRRRRPRSNSSFSRQQQQQHADEASSVVRYDNPQLVLSALLRDLSFWELPPHQCGKPNNNKSPSQLVVNNPPSSTIRASDPQRDISTTTIGGGGGGTMLSAPRSGLLSRSGQRVAAMPGDGGGGGASGSNGPEGNDTLGPLRRQQQMGNNYAEEKKVESSSAPASSATTSSTKPASSSSSGRVWKSAVDPASGRTYYYDAATRQTQWEKPEEVRAEERRIKKEKRRLEQIFFEEVRSNVLASLARGELIPGVPRNETTSQGPPLEPVLSPTSSLASLTPTSPQGVPSKHQNAGAAPPSALTRTQQPNGRGTSSSSGSGGGSSSNARIRTISGMNEKLLAELHNPPPSSNHSTSSSNAAAARSNAPRLPPAVQVLNSATSATTNEGRPPLPRGRSMTMRDDQRASNGATLLSSSGAQYAPSSASIPPNKPTNNHHYGAQDSLELSPDPVVHHKQRRGTDNRTAGPADIAANDAAELEGERLLDGPIFGGEGTKVSATSKSSSATATSKPRQGDDGTTLSTSSHMRRNTGGTVFVQSTMENPNIKATIKCVCGVYRAHVLSSSSSSSSSTAAAAPASSRDPVSVAAFEIFRDETHRDYRRVVSQHAAPTPPVPSLHEIETFYFDFYRRSQMEQDTIIMSLIYVERLIKETNGALTPSPWNWKSILFSCMVLSSKVWDDLSMFNLDFSNVSMAVSTSQSVASTTGPAPSSSLSSFSLQRTNALEIALLQTLNFNVRVAASEYAKYYFLIRTMLLRSGLLDESNGDKTNSDKKDLTGPATTSSDEGQRLENRSSRYQAQLQRRAKSVDWTFGSASSISEPVLKDSVCLEQLLAGQRS